MGALVKALVLDKADEPGSAGDEDLAPSGKRLATTCALSPSDAPHKAGTHRRPAVPTTPTAAHGAPHSAAHHLPDHAHRLP